MTADGAGRRPGRGRTARRRAWIALFLLLGLAGTAGLVALGNWQVARRAWKLDLIERVDARIHAPPVPAPAPGDWPRVSEAADEYRRVRLTGTFLPGPGTPVQASTARGAGFWLMAPFGPEGGGTVLVNRGFVPGDRAGVAERADPPPPGRVAVVGLLRLSQPGGGFLRANDPAGGWWYSRDVAAIAAARGLDGPVAPFFVDAEAGAGGGDRPPIGGLTVVSFPNSHLVYALTWYGLALMLGGATSYLARAEWRAGREGA